MLKELALEITVYNYTFFKKINSGKSFHIPEKIFFFLLTAISGPFFFTGEIMCFHSMDCNFNSGP